jgi:hypothetical protein
LYWHSFNANFNQGGITLANRAITGISTVLLGALIACVPNFILPICPHCQSMMMKCIWAAKAEFGVGVVVMFLAVLLAFVDSREIRLGVSAALGFVGIFSALIAKVLIGFCDGSCSPNCGCNPVTEPVMAGLGILVAVISFINVFYLSRSKNT